ncbi:MAG TPA: globin family protein [Longimicrobium sp.]|nr:globin family protein [Longimicrobium sp.]
MPLNVAVLERSFARVKPKASQFAADFYEELFSRHPETRRLFAGTDMAEQRKKLMDSLVLVIENLDNPDVLTDALRRLGGRHAGYGVSDENYGMVATALLHTFARHLGAEWTPEVEAAWVEAYGVVSQIMQQGAVAAGPR